MAPFASNQETMNQRQAGLVSSSDLTRVRPPVAIFAHPISETISEKILAFSRRSCAMNFI